MQPSSLSTAPYASPRSLLATMRVGGLVLVVGSLSALASYLVIQKGWIEPLDPVFRVASALEARADDLRIAIADERTTRALREHVPGAVDYAVHETDRRWKSVQAALVPARAIPIEGEAASEELWQSLEGAIREWRVSTQAPPDGSSEVAYGEVRSRWESAKGALTRFRAGLTEELDRLVRWRTWLLLLISGAGGLLAWGATGLAIRRTRHSLRRISQHVEAIARGEHAPQTLEAFSEIALVNERLNELGDELNRAQEEARNGGRAARERQRELECAHELALELSRAASEDEVVAAFLRLVPPAVGGGDAEVLRLDKSRGVLEEVAAAARGAGVKPRIVGDPSVCAGFRTGAAAPETGVARSCPAAPTVDRPAVCIPLHSSEGRSGVVHLMPESETAAARMPRPFAETLVRLLGSALDNRRLLRESIERSATDPLTGLANRRRLEEHGTKALALALRQGTPLSVVVLDLDRFKEINDTFGHDEGDRALVSVARALQANLRETDLAARLGGDEFAILLPGSEASQAAIVVERVREALTAGATTRGYRIGLSAGVSELSPRASSLEELIGQADRALYDARRGGRTRSGDSLAASA